jgi:hypothetical protein
MWYKGNDLDLRAPYAGQGGGRGDAGPFEARRGGTIAVDQTVLACCNGAYDAALFHGAREIRPEHLLYALTRVEAARGILEQHGISAQRLRREAAAAIAAETPAAGADGRGPPRASAELEDLLRAAAGRAVQDGVAASVHDVMRALLGHGRDAPATGLLLQAAADPQALERWGAEPPAGLLAGSAANPLQPDAAARLQGRLEQLEAAMRALAAEVAAGHKDMRDLFGEMRQALPSGDAGGAIEARLAAIDRVLAGLGERFEAIRAFAPGDGAAGLAARLSALEEKLSAQPPAIADAVAIMLTNRRGAGGDDLAALAAGEGGGAAERLAEVEAMLRAQAERLEEARGVHERDMSEIYEALVKLGTNQQTLGSNLEAWRLDSSGDVSIVSNRLEGMERALKAILPRPRPQPPAAAETAQPLSAAGGRDDSAARGFKRWLYGTARVFPSSWREDMHALRETLRPRRRNGGA